MIRDRVPSSAAASCASAPTVLGTTRLEAHVALDNHASRRVAQAAGFTHASIFTEDDGTEMIRYTRDVSGGEAALIS